MWLWLLLLQVAKEMAPTAAAEYGSAQVWGSKKANMNHLLNFHFEARSHPSSGYAVGRYGDGRHGNRRNLPYNKERFLQAKYVQF